jgi:Bacteriophage lambda head decoration protein D
MPKNFPVIVQSNNLGDLLKYEAPNLYSRNQETVAAGQNLLLGSVVGRETASAKLKALDPSATDGTQIAVGVLGNDVDATLMEREDALLIERHAVVARSALVWPSGISAQHKVLAIEQLEARGILIRDGA